MSETKPTLSREINQTHVEEVMFKHLEEIENLQTQKQDLEKTVQKQLEDSARDKSYLKNISEQIVLGTLQGCWKLRGINVNNEQKNFQNGEDSEMYLIRDYSVHNVKEKMDAILTLDNNGSYNMNEWIVAEIQLNSVVWKRKNQDVMFWSRFYPQDNQENGYTGQSTSEDKEVQILRQEINDLQDALRKVNGTSITMENDSGKLYDFIINSMQGYWVTCQGNITVTVNKNICNFPNEGPRKIELLKNDIMLDGFKLHKFGQRNISWIKDNNVIIAWSRQPKREDEIRNDFQNIIITFLQGMWISKENVVVNIGGTSCVFVGSQMANHKISFLNGKCFINRLFLEKLLPNSIVWNIGDKEIIWNRYYADGEEIDDKENKNHTTTTESKDKNKLAMVNADLEKRLRMKTRQITKKDLMIQSLQCKVDLQSREAQTSKKFKKRRPKSLVFKDCEEIGFLCDDIRDSLEKDRDILSDLCDDVFKEEVNHSPPRRQSPSLPSEDSLLDGFEN